MVAVAFLFVFCSATYAQNQSAPKKYVRIDIGHGALHCPFLGPKFETQMKEVKGVENFFIDKQNSYTTFNLPADTEMTVASLQKIGIDVGYPAADVIVAIDTKPISAPTKPK